MVDGIPIYVNQDLVLDLTALMFGGFEESRDVRNRDMIEFHLRKNNENRTQATERDVVINHHDLGKFHGEIELLKDVNSTFIFTDFSRFNNVRAMLLEKNMINQIIEEDIFDSNIKCCEYVEFTANMTTTSLLSSINTLIGVIESYDIKMLDNLMRIKLPGITNITFILNQLKFLSSSLSMNNTTDIVLNTNSSNMVLTVDLNDFSNKNAYVYDLAHWELRVLGKVSRIVDENNYFDLLRKTATSDYYNRFLESLAPYLEILNINGILVPDKFTTKVNGPGLNIIPIAIYV